MWTVGAGDLESWEMLNGMTCTLRTGVTLSVRPIRVYLSTNKGSWPCWNDVTYLTRDATTRTGIACDEHTAVEVNTKYNAETLLRRLRCSYRVYTVVLGCTLLLSVQPMYVCTSRIFTRRVNGGKMAASTIVPARMELGASTDALTCAYLSLCLCLSHTHTHKTKHACLWTWHPAHCVLCVSLSWY